MAKVKITDTILRDAHQSQAATRMRLDAIDRLEGMIHTAEREFARFETTSGVQLAGKSEQVYEVPCTFSLCDGFNVLHVFALMETQNLDDLSVDVVARVRVKGISKTLRYSDISIKDWIK